MGPYILRRLLLVIPTLLGILLVNFTLTQFVPGGPVEQAIARAQGGGDVFGGFAGGNSSQTCGARHSHKSPTILARKGFAGSFDGVDISGHDPIGQGAEDGGRSVQQ